MQLPRMLPVRQNFPDRGIRDIPGEVKRQLHSSNFGAGMRPGARIALGVGSRGISNIATIVRSAVEYWKDQGAAPFIFPAMGSHGAATAEGQADVLAHYGIHEATMGCPVLSALDVVSLGKNPDGIEAFMDKNAYSSDGVMLIGRIKWHTDFAGKIESGLFKMMAIGLGKFAGAQRYHTYAYKLGLEHVIRGVGRQVLSFGQDPGWFGHSRRRQSQHRSTDGRAGGADGAARRRIAGAGEELDGKDTVSALDILMLDEIGKNISGAGMDTKVVNRSPYGESNIWPDTPRIERIFIRDLSDSSYGNAVGLGMADVIHERMLEKIDWHPTQINSLTASSPQAIRTPVHFASDRECLERFMPTVGKVDLAEVTIGWLANSLELSMLKLSENLRRQIEKNSALEILGPAEEFEFDAAGNLPKLRFAGLPAAALTH